MGRQRTVLMVLALVMLVVVFVKGRHSGKEPAVAAFFVPARPVGWVQVGGMVGHTGTYPVFDKNMTISVIKMAEPLCWPALPLSTISDMLDNDSALALTIHCPDKAGSGYAEVHPLPAQQRLVLGLPLSLSRASLEELALVPGIGPVLADRIVQYRHKNGDFTQIEELLLVEGVGEKTLAKLSSFIKP